MPIKKGGIKAISTKSSGGGNIISSLGNAINKSNANIKKEFEKPSVKEGLQKAVKLASGVLSVTPIGKAVVMATVAIADKATNSHSASSYLGTDKNNSTISLLPGGLLAQQILEVADPNIARKLESAVPDPKRVAIARAEKTIEKPKNTLSNHHIDKPVVAKPSLLSTITTKTESLTPKTTISHVQTKHPISGGIKSTIGRRPDETSTISTIFNENKPPVPIKVDDSSTLSSLKPPPASEEPVKPSLIPSEIFNPVPEAPSTLQQTATNIEIKEATKQVKEVEKPSINSDTVSETPKEIESEKPAPINVSSGGSTLERLAVNASQPSDDVVQPTDRRQKSFFDFCIIA